MKPYTSTRRQWLSTQAALAASGAWILIQPASASTEELNVALKAYSGGATVREGRVKLDIAPIVDNGNTVPIQITVDSPMSADSHVTAIAVFNERNPQREVVKFVLGPRAGKAIVSTRIRLATTQKLVAIARFNDGTYWSQAVDVIVSIAACIED